MIREEETSRINVAQKKVELQAIIKDAQEQVGKARKVAEKNLARSTELVKEAEAKQQVMYDYLKERFYKLAAEQEKRKGGLGSLFRREEDDFEIPQFIIDQKDKKKSA